MSMSERSSLVNDVLPLKEKRRNSTCTESVRLSASLRLLLMWKNS
jgi:hypothetical protein